MADWTVFNVAKEFAECPGGRHKSDGPHSAEELREDHLVPLLAKGRVEIRMDGVMGYPASFLEEAFGGLVRKLGVGVGDRISFVAHDLPDAAQEARQFMDEQIERDRA